jgi:hypothetical protein
MFRRLFLVAGALVAPHLAFAGDRGGYGAGPYGGGPYGGGNGGYGGGGGYVGGFNGNGNNWGYYPGIYGQRGGPGGDCWRWSNGYRYWVC